MPKQYHKNPRQITTKQMTMLAHDLAELGDLSGIVHDLNSDEIIGGNQRSKVFRLEECQIELTEQYDKPDEQGTVGLGFVIWQGKRYAYRAVRWDAKTAEKANIVANKAGGTWDFDVLANEFEIGDLLEWGFEAFELGLEEEEPEPPEDPGPQIDRAEELRQKWGVEPGQLWILGKHRLICGDCTDASVVERVMSGEKIDCITTDPPYGVDYDGGTTKRKKLQGDKSPSLYFPALVCWKPYCTDSVALYLWYADGDQAVAQAVAQAGWQVRRNLIWNKNQAQYGALSQQYKQKHEPFLYCHIKNKAPYWAGDGTEVTVWDIDRESTNEFHPTQKPPALFARAIRNSSRDGAIVFDGFCGSGTTLIACEQLGRKCRAVEISPAYVSVALERWAEMTGETPDLITD